MTAMQNTLKLDDLLKVAAELGTDAGKGKDTQIKFLLKTFEGAFQGVIDLDTNKHGADTDDSTKLAEAYVKAQTGSVVFDAKAPNQRKLISTLRTAVKLGQWPKGGAGEPASTVNSLMTIRQKLRSQPENAKKLDDAANTFLRYARQQTKRDTLIGDSELKTICFKAQHALQTPEQILESVRKQLQLLRDGKAAQGTASDNSTHVVAAIGEITKRLKAIAVQRGTAKGPASTVGG